jgi:hypothetical protein
MPGAPELQKAMLRAREGKIGPVDIYERQVPYVQTAQQVVAAEQRAMEEVARRWHQGDHYDIALTKRALAVAAGAREIRWRQCAAMQPPGRPSRGDTGHGRAARARAGGAAFNSGGRIIIADDLPGVASLAK